MGCGRLHDQHCAGGERLGTPAHPRPVRVCADPLSRLAAGDIVQASAAVTQAELGLPSTLNRGEGRRGDGRRPVPLGPQRRADLPQHHLAGEQALEGFRISYRSGRGLPWNC
jgi:hypothetical protein